MTHYQKLSIKDWAIEDRPREKLRYKGLLSLTEAELIAILIGSGNPKESAVQLARRILGHVKNNLHELSKLDIDGLKQFNGIGEAKAISIIAALELGRRRNQTDALKKDQITCSKEAAAFITPKLGDLSHEEFWTLYLNRQNQIIHHEKISQGGLTGTIIDVRIILRKGILHQATAIILCHNHPSGNLEPSEADKNLTVKVKKAAEIMDIPVLDHLIITQTGYLSFADKGIL